MDLISEIITGVLLSGTCLYMTITSCAKIKKINTVSVFKILFYLILMTLIVLEILCIMDIIHYLKFLSISHLLITILNSIILSVVALLTINEVTPKKLKTIWRLPIIGFLLGYLSPDFQFYVNLGIWAVILLIYTKNQLQLRILNTHIWALLIWIVSIYFIRENSFWYLNTILIFFCLITFKLWDMISIKSLVWEKNE